MDQATHDRLREQLEQEHAQQLAILEEHGADPYGEAVKDLDVGDAGFADSGQATEQRSELLAYIDTARTRLHQVEDALEQMDEGTYGVCVSCGEEILPARLEARPLSIHCVDCAAKQKS